MYLYPRAVTRYQEKQQFWWLQPVVPLWDLPTTLCVGFAPGESVLSRWGPGTGTFTSGPQRTLLSSWDLVTGLGCSLGKAISGGQ